MGTNGTVSIGVARVLLNAAGAARISRAELLKRAELDLALLRDDDARLALTDLYRLCEVLLDVTGDPALGLNWRNSIDYLRFGLISSLVSHATTLRAALDSVKEFQRLCVERPSYEIIEADGKLCVRCDPMPDASPEVRRFILETVVLGFWQLIARHGAEPSLITVSFDYPAPSYRDQYTSAFAGRAEFDQEFSGIEVPTSVLDRASDSPDEDVHRALSALAQRRMSRMLNKVPFGERVRDLLVREGPARIGMQQVARELGVSERTLRRRLTEEGSSFEGIVMEASSVVAQELLLNSNLAIQDIASRLGFSHSSAFHRAFKRWTGLTPLAFRTRCSRA